MTKLTLSVHAHFYQPPRRHPLTGHIGSERSAAPYRNWNERATEEIYQPNAETGNFATLSFDIGESLLDWLQFRRKVVYQNIIDSAKSYSDKYQVGNMLAAPRHQAPLPTLSERDRLAQLRWGATTVQARFGYLPKGVFLPHFAANDATLQSVVQAGFAYTVLRSKQVNGLPPRGGAGPYRLRLANGESIRVFVIDDALSASMIEEMVERGGAGFWARQELAPFIRHAGNLTLLYVDGQLLGQHKMAEAHFIHYLLRYEAPAAAFHLTTLEEYFRQAPDPIGELELLPYQAEEPSEAQVYLFAALRQLMQEADALFAEVYGDQAWKLRERALDMPNPDDMLLSQYALQQAWANATTLEIYPQLSLAYVLRDAAYAVYLIENATQTDLSAVFMQELPARGATLFEEALDGFRKHEKVKVTVS